MEAHLLVSRLLTVTPADSIPPASIPSPARQRPPPVLGGAVPDVADPALAPVAAAPAPPRPLFLLFLFLGTPSPPPPVSLCTKYMTTSNCFLSLVALSVNLTSKVGRKNLKGKLGEFFLLTQSFYRPQTKRSLKRQFSPKSTEVGQKLS